jgi:hypothetical protein
MSKHPLHDAFGVVDRALYTDTKGVFFGIVLLPLFFAILIAAKTSAAYSLGIKS